MQTRARLVPESVRPLSGESGRLERRYWRLRGVVWALGALLLLPARAETPGGEGQPMRGSRPGEYVLSQPPAGKPWLLPSPGDGFNSCEAGDILSAHWAPEGDMALTEVDSGRAVTLCLFDLTWFSPGRGQPLVRVERVSSTGRVPASAAKISATGTGSARSSASAYERLRARAEGAGGFSEYEPSWTSRKAGGRVAFTLSREQKPPGVVGVTDLRAAGRWEPSRLDGGAVGGQERAYQARWSPDGAALVFVTDRELRCGRERLALRFPFRPGAGAPFLLTRPCEGGGGSARDVSDRYPAWSPASPEGRLAFLRIELGRDVQLCVLEQGLSERETEPRCDWLERAGAKRASRSYPTWSPDGRYVALFASPTLPGAKAAEGPAEQLEILDLRASPPALRTVERVRSHPLQGPTWGGGPAGEGPLLYVVPEADAHRGWLRVIAPGGDGKTLETGLRNLKTVTTLSRAGQTWLGLISQGYDGVRGADMGRDKLFLLALPEK